MLNNISQFPILNQWWFPLLVIWVFIWKGLALWKSARVGKKWWFVAFLVVNTLGVLEIAYLYVFSRRKS